MILARPFTTMVFSTAIGIWAVAADAVGPANVPKIDATPFLGDHYPARRVSFPAGVSSFADVTYSMISGFRPLTLDLYLPPKAKADAKAVPLVLYIHGGGWANGHARQSGAFDDWPRVLASLAARGYAVASLNYRLSSEAPFPAAIQDVKSAIKFLRAHAAEYGIDPSEAIVWGGSAGGHLAALAATTCGVKELEPPPPQASPEAAVIAQQSDCVQGAVTWYGIFDLATMAGPSPGVSPAAIARFLGCGDTACPAQKLQDASPEHYYKADMPPFLLVHGAADKTVDPAQSRHFLDAGTASGGRIALLMIPGADHSFIGQTPAATRDASLLALNRTFDFIDSTLRHSRQ